MKKLHALVLGGTGATGQELVTLLLESSNFNKVSVFARRSINIKHEKLIVHKIDFSKLEDYKELVIGDVFFSALGTTRKDATSKEKQYLVDYTYQYEFAKMASGNGVNLYSLVSSVGANEKSYFFYPKIKGALENAIMNLSFKKIQIFQPPSLIRQPNLIRYGEQISIAILNRLNNIGILKSFKPLLVNDLAVKMIAESLSENSKDICIYKPKDIYIQ